MIDIVVPVLSRPENAAPLVDSIRANTTVEKTITFICSAGDSKQMSACWETKSGVLVVDWPPGPGDAAMKWNWGYRITGKAELSYPFVLLAADDLEFTPGWDTAAMEVAKRSNAGVIGTQDSMNPMVKKGKHATHPIVRRSYIDEFGGTFDQIPGVVYCEQYDHQAVENELLFLAKERGQWAFAHRSVVIHHHPMFDKTVKRDPTYDKALAHGREDIRLYQDRVQAWTRNRRATVL